MFSGGIEGDDWYEIGQRQFDHVTHFWIAHK